ncbi:MAG TPA: hypothetical protein VK714_14105 [Myxococcota bacterium]|nr:hypothetical protein [Myxococcota bacterium]
MTAKPPASWRAKTRRTQLRRASQQAARRLVRRLFLITKFERTWRGLTRFRAKVGASRFRSLMADVPDALGEIRNPDPHVLAEPH